MISLMISIVGVNLVDNLLEREPSFSYYAGGALTMVALIGFYALLAREGSDSKKEEGAQPVVYTRNGRITLHLCQKRRV
jgi:hypothetical protein